MDAGRQVLLRRDSDEQARELGSFRAVQGGANVLLVFAADSFDFPQRLKPRLGQEERVRSPIGRVVTASISPRFSSSSSIDTSRLGNTPNFSPSVAG